MLELVQSEIGRVENDNTEPTQNDEAKISTNVCSILEYSSKDDF